MPGIEKLRQFMTETMSARHDVSLEERREGLDKLMSTLDPVVDTVERVERLIDEVPCVAFEPDSPVRDGVLIYIHGGAFVAGSTQSHGGLISRLAAGTGLRAIGINYRLAPEHAFPAASEDCEAVVASMLSGGYGPIYLAGDSAGGALAASTALSINRLTDRAITRLAMLSPVTDLTCESETYATLAECDPFITKAGFEQDFGHYLAGAIRPCDPAVSPLFADLRSLPPTLIQVGRSEVLLDDARRFAHAAEKVGKPVKLSIYPDMLHCWQMFPTWVTEASDAVDEIIDFFAQDEGFDGSQEI